MVQKIFTTILIFSFCSCSTIWSKSDSGKNDSSEMSNAATGALTGAAVGGGLGLLVGSTSGAVGEGLIVGSLAGGALGAGIGAQLDSEKGEVRKHKESIIEQDETIKNQDIEIKKLKINTSDRAKLIPSKTKAKGKNLAEEDMAIITPAAKLSANPRARLASGDIVYLSKPSGTKKAIPYAGAGISNVSLKKSASEPKNEESSLLASNSFITKKEIIKNIKEESRTYEAIEEKPFETKTISETSKKTNSLVNSLPAAVVEAPKENSAVATKATPKSASQEDCKQSVKEAERGLNASSDADRLFYLRRASRLCPQEANYHVELGKIYSSIGKNDDAKYEFRQAIDLDADNQVARDELSIIENAGSSNR